VPRRAVTVEAGAEEPAPAVVASSPARAGSSPGVAWLLCDAGEDAAASGQRSFRRSPDAAVRLRPTQTAREVPEVGEVARRSSHHVARHFRRRDLTPYWHPTATP